LTGLTQTEQPSCQPTQNAQKTCWDSRHQLKIIYIKSGRFVCDIMIY